MIEIKMTGMCEDCERADLEVDYLPFDDDKKMWTIRCIHDNACDQMESRMIEKFAARYGEIE